MLCWHIWRKKPPTLNSQLPTINYQLSTMTTTLLLIRHGRTAHNAERRWQGHLDVPLDAVGQAQVQALAARLASWPGTAVYSSDLQRAASTAAPLAAVWNISPVYQADWRERHVGLFEGRATDELQEAFPDVFARMRQGVIEIPERRSVACGAAVCGERARADVAETGV